jgi:aspartate carbamoyltransferase catalytic subunit
MGYEMNSGKRDINSINDLENGEIQDIFELADEYCGSMSQPGTPYQIRGRRAEAKDFILATLFYEPSTRTRFSFEAAMLRLGGNVLASTDPAMTSVSKGESLADTVRVIENYADLIVLRHPWEGAARAAAEYVSIPVINGGDGSHEHPTQTLCDLYTLRQEHTDLKGLNVLIVGDLKNGRTVHSLVYALARFGANIITMPGEGLELPIEVSERLESEFDYNPVPEAEKFLGDSSRAAPIGAVYVASPAGQQLTLFGGDPWNLADAQRRFKRVHVCYVTRQQKERFSAGQNISDYPIVDKNFLSGEQYKKSKVLHPLPRVGELDYELDRDPRGVYFKQAGYGVPVRMALIAKVLGIREFKSKSIHSTSSVVRPVYEHGGQMICTNEKCITHNATEQKYLPHKAHVILGNAVSLRCVYCEASIPVAFIGNKKTRRYLPADRVDGEFNVTKVLLFRDASQAREAGYRPTMEKGDTTFPERSALR